LHPVGKYTVIGAGGDMSDFQYIQKSLEELIIDEFTSQDGHDLGPAQIHEYLSQVMYSRRSKLNPLWNSLLVGGFKDGKRYLRFRLSLEPNLLIVPPSFLSYVDLLGTTYSASTLATGYGAYIAQPLLRKEVEGKEDILTEEEAVRIMETCIRVLYYRDARSIGKVRANPIFPFEHLLSSFNTSINLLLSLQTGSVSQNLAPSQRRGRSLKALEGMAPRPSEFHEQCVYFVNPFSRSVSRYGKPFYSLLSVLGQATTVSELQ